ncbi:MAG TPA: hypothetical protein VHG91_21160 [Longimicrobium sp.]|nr:hypothetical protein [Longimicrobium sp.]
MAVLLAAALAAGACTAEVEEEGRAPDVDVQPGELPEVDVDPARVEVGQDAQKVVTPDVDIVPTEGDDP